MKKLLLILIIPFLSIGQIVTEDCSSIPNPGMCFAAIQIYYFDQNTGQCEESVWGGCDGLVPFWTLEECQNSCESISIGEITNPKNLLKKTDILGRETSNNKGFQLHVYGDGSVKKKYVIK